MGAITASVILSASTVATKSRSKLDIADYILNKQASTSSPTHNQKIQ